MTTSEELLKQEELNFSQFKKEYSLFYKIKKFINFRNNIAIGLLYAIAVALLFWIRIKQGETHLSIWQILETLLIGVYPGMFVIGFICLILEQPADYLTFKYFNTTKKHFQYLERKERGFKNSISNIGFKIRKDKWWDDRQKEKAKKQEQQKAIPKETVRESSGPVVKQTEPSKQVITPVVETKAAEIPKQKTKEEIELEERKEESLWRQLQLLAILAEARLKQRLYDFSLMLLTKQCPPKAQDYIYRLLKEEIDGLKERDCQIHNRSYYVAKFEEIQALIGIKPASQPAVSVTQIQKPVHENKSVAETFKDYKATSTKNESDEKVVRITPKQDFETLNRYKNDVGFLGEEYIFEEEKKKLKNANREDLIPHVEWVSKDSDAWGYDIRSYSEKGELMYIEVKTTTSGKASTFYLSETELNQMNSLENYYIYRVYDFSIKDKQGSVFPVSKTELPLFFNLEPLSYKVKLK